jgi:triosephosphate isomerase (TIM)
VQVVEASKNAKDANVAVVPPFPFLAPVAAVLKGSNVALGAQDLYIEDKGAFTGAVSTSMIKSVGAGWVLVGHSERRT